MSSEQSNWTPEQEEALAKIAERMAGELVKADVIATFRQWKSPFRAGFDFTLGAVIAVGLLMLISDLLEAIVRWLAA